MKIKNFAFISDNILEYAEVTGRAAAHGAVPIKVVAMVRYTPQTSYVNHKSALAIGVRNDKLLVWTEAIPEDCEVVTLAEVRKMLPRQYDTQQM